MKILMHSLTIELEESDPRVGIIQTLLFGKPLPKPMPIPDLFSGPGFLSERHLRFWKSLDATSKKELELLSEQPYAPSAMEAAIPLSQRRLMGQHQSINRLARSHGVPVRLLIKGRGRAGRKYFLDDPAAALVKALLKAERESS